MKTPQKLVALGLLVLILAAIVGLFMTRESRLPSARSRPRLTPLVDEQVVQTARRMATLASTREEQRYAQQAVTLADHAVDLAFSNALREATAHPGATTPESKELFERVRRAQAQVKSDQELIDELKKESARAKSPSDDAQGQLDLLTAQLELDQDDLDDANGDLLRSGADILSRVRRQFARYEASDPLKDAAMTQALLPPADSIAPPTNLWAQISTWRGLRDKAASLQQARDEALQKHVQLQHRHDATEESSSAPGASSSVQSPKAGNAVDQGAQRGDSQDQKVIATLHRLADQRKTLVDLDKRIQDHQDLADAYSNWIGLVEANQRSAIHRIIRSLLIIVLVVFAVYLLDLAVDRLFVGFTPDHRRMRTLRVITRFVLQAAGALLALLVLLGVPNQMPTILGLAGAGLTVALKDFIVAFFGWFALMGRNGIRVGDWVEIQGVVGEVVEIGLMRTVLLETGNWNDAGHPTGRKVAFVNSYAIEGHYFNFSTSGQWLWDELQVLVPTSENPYPVVDAVQKVVAANTQENSRMAEEEWKRATRDRMQSVSAAPAINLRPTPAGVDVHVRYITRANERYATRTKLYQDIVGVLHQRPEPASPARSS
jgi:small-conductance mechanosensitive channel